MVKFNFINSVCGSRRSHPRWPSSRTPPKHINLLSERGVKKISIWAIDPRTGEMAQRFLPGPEVAGYCGWYYFNNAINAIKRKDGEYLLFAEDDGAQKVNLFRWRP